MDHGSGAILVDVDGNQLIDLGCGEKLTGDATTVREEVLATLI